MVAEQKEKPSDAQSITDVATAFLIRKHVFGTEAYQRVKADVTDVRPIKVRGALEERHGSGEVPLLHAHGAHSGCSITTQSVPESKTLTCAFLSHSPYQTPQRFQ